MKKYILISILLVLAVFSCKKEVIVIPPTTGGYPNYINFTLPQGFPQMVIPTDNKLSVEGIELGRHLFYETKLSGNNTQSCGSCHQASNSFADTGKFSIGIDNLAGDRNSMALVNLGWGKKFFWDGRENSLENQAFAPVTNPIEMHEKWGNAVAKLQGTSKYPVMFAKAFGTSTIDSVLVSKALSQFMRTLVSGNSRFDKARRGEITLTNNEEKGFESFKSLTGADCFHCHGGILFTDYSFQNNGIDSVLTDLGLGKTTGNPNDYGKFKVPTLRNLVFTAPYMHDGRFATLDEVIDQYSEGVHGNSPNISPSMEFSSSGGVNLGLLEKIQLKAFLLSLTDSNFTTNPAFQDPN